MAEYALGLDIGGTFTDIVVYEQSQAASYSHKELTTPDAPYRGVVAGPRPAVPSTRAGALLPSHFRGAKSPIHGTISSPGSGRSDRQH